MMQLRGQFIILVLLATLPHAVGLIGALKLSLVLHYVAVLFRFYLFNLGLPSFTTVLHKCKAIFHAYEAYLVLIASFPYVRRKLQCDNCVFLEFNCFWACLCVCTCLWAMLPDLNNDVDDNDDDDDDMQTNIKRNLYVYRNVHS